MTSATFARPAALACVAILLPVLAHAAPARVVVHRAASVARPITTSPSSAPILVGTSLIGTLGLLRHRRLLG